MSTENSSHFAGALCGCFRQLQLVQWLLHELQTDYTIPIDYHPPRNRSRSAMNHNKSVETFIDRMNRRYLYENRNFQTIFFYFRFSWYLFPGKLFQMLLSNGKFRLSLAKIFQFFVKKMNFENGKFICKKKIPKIYLCQQNLSHDEFLL